MKFIPVFVALLLAVGAPAWAAPAHHAAKAKAAAGHVALPANVRPDRYDIVMRPDAAHLTFSGQEKIALTVTSATSRIELNAADIAFQKASLSGRSEAPRV